MGITLAVTHYIGDLQPEETTSYCQTGTAVVLERHKPTHKTFNPNISCLQEMLSLGMEQKLREWTIYNCPDLKPIPCSSINPLHYY